MSDNNTEQDDSYVSPFLVEHKERLKKIEEIQKKTEELILNNSENNKQ